MVGVEDLGGKRLDEGGAGVYYLGGRVWDGDRYGVGAAGGEDSQQRAANGERASARDARCVVNRAGVCRWKTSARGD
ncbi:hypothetical protein GCM10027269_81930 [Kribbella endophytica]